METRFVIYKIYWPKKGFYYGKTRGFGKRRNRHLREMRDGTHHNKNLIRKFNLYGPPIIKIVAFAQSDEDLATKEKFFLQKHKASKISCNICTC